MNRVFVDHPRGVSVHSTGAWLATLLLGVRRAGAGEAGGRPRLSRQRRTTFIAVRPGPLHAFLVKDEPAYLVMLAGGLRASGFVDC